MKIDGQLYRAQLECRTSDLANTITGAIWFRTDTSAVKLATGSGYITLTSGAPDGTTLQNSADVWSVKDGGITNVKVNASAAIAYSKLALTNSIVEGDLTALSISTGKLQDQAVSTAKIAAGAVTPSRMTTNTTLSSGSGTFSDGSGSFTNVTNLTGSITTTGGRLLVKIVGDNRADDQPAKWGTADGSAWQLMIYTGVDLNIYTLHGYTAIPDTFFAAGSGTTNVTIKVKALTTAVDFYYAKLLLMEV